MTKLRREARGRDCQIRSPVCNGNPDTTVLAHLNGAGWGRKNSDLACGAWACSDCHDLVDGRRQSEYPPETRKLWHLEGVVRTLEILEREGVIGVIRGG